MKSIKPIKEAFELINQVEHNDLRVKTHSNYAHLKTLNNSPIFAEEIPEVAANLPVVLLKDSRVGTFKLSTLFGLIGDENLLVDEKNNWTGSYVPVVLNLEPFGLVLDAQSDDKRMTLNVNSSCLSKTEGNKLFENQQETPYLINMRRQLNTIVDASVQTDTLIAELVNRNLLTEFKISINGLSNGPQVIHDLYTINTDEFSHLSNEDIVMFHKMNYWGAIYAIQHSMKQFKNLIQLRNNRHPNNQITLEIHIDKESD